MLLFSVFFFFSSRRRHTRCALVTGVQTCALPIWRALPAAAPPDLVGRRAGHLGTPAAPRRPLSPRLAVHRAGAAGVGCKGVVRPSRRPPGLAPGRAPPDEVRFFMARSEEHTSELQSLMRISYAVFCLKKTKIHNT